MQFKRIKMSEKSTVRLRTIKTRTKVTPNVACRLALSLSLKERNLPSLELYSEDTGQEINRYTLFGEHELILISLFIQWCHENKIEEKNHFQYFTAHINRGIELLVNRVKGLEDLVYLVH